MAFSLVRKIPDTSIIPQARAVCGAVGYAPYAIPGSEELGRSLADAFARGFDSVLLENHGVATGGRTLLEAFQRFETLDFCARTLINATTLGPVAIPAAGRDRPLPAGKEPVPARSAMPCPRSSVELSLRRDMREMVHRAYRQRLMTSTEGTVSARVDADSFLISPFGVDRSYLDESDFVLVRRGMRERGTRAQPGGGPAPGDLRGPARDQRHRQRAVTGGDRVLRDRPQPGQRDHPRELRRPAHHPARPFRQAVHRREGPRAGDLPARTGGLPGK